MHSHSPEQTYRSDNCRYQPKQIPKARTTLYPSIMEAKQRNRPRHHPPNDEGEWISQPGGEKLGSFRRLLVGIFDYAHISPRSIKPFQTSAGLYSYTHDKPRRNELPSRALRARQFWNS